MHGLTRRYPTRSRSRLGIWVIVPLAALLAFQDIGFAKPQYRCMQFQPPPGPFDDFTPQQLCTTLPGTPPGLVSYGVLFAFPFPFLIPLTTGDAKSQPTPQVGQTDPISADGEFAHSVVDLTLPGPGFPFVFRRMYRSRIQYRGTLGYSWDHSYNQRLVGGAAGFPTCDDQIDFYDGQLGTVHFVRVPNTANPAIYRTKQPIPLELQRPSSGDPAWVLVDRASGLMSYFDTWGYLSSISDYSGNGQFVSWEASATPSAPRRIHHVIDTAHRTIYYNYGANDLLKCISFQSVSVDQQCVSPLVSFEIKNDPTRTDFGQLRSVRLADDAQPTEKYLYTYGNTLSTLIPDAVLQPYCASMCNTAVGANGSPLCTNENVCAKGLDACRSLADTSDECVAPDPNDPDYAHKRDLWQQCEDRRRQRIVGNCEAYCVYDGRTGCCDQLSDVSCDWCFDQVCAPTCEGGFVPYQGYPNYFTWQAESCLQNFQEDFAFCGSAPANCESDCVAQMRSKFNGAPQYILGAESDLNNNLVEIRNGNDELIVSNAYGGDPETVDYDRVIGQNWGNHGDYLTLNYHDLALEQSPPPFAQKAPSTPDPQHVQSLAAFNSSNVCSGCTLGALTCAPDVENDTGPEQSQRPTHAVVQTDIYGRVWVRYYDSKRGWSLLREINFATSESVDYNATNGYSTGIRTADGRRICTQRDDRGLIIQVDRLPAPGRPGGAQAVQERFEYAAAAPFLLRHVLDVATGATETFDPVDDYTWRVGATHRTVNALSDPTQVLTWTTQYQPNGYYVSAQIAPDSSEVRYANYSDSAAAPQLVTIDATGPSPVTTTYQFDLSGNLLSGGQPHRATSAFAYDRAGRRLFRWRRIDDASPWIRDETRWIGQTPYVNIGDTRTVLQDTDSSGQVFHRLVIPTNLNNDNAYEVQNTCFHRRPDGRLIDVLFPEGNFRHYDYDDAGRLVQLTGGYPGPLPTEWTSSWAQACRSNISPVPARSVETLATYEYLPGGVLRAATKLGIRTEYVTDGFGRVIESIDAVGHRARVGYDSRSRVVWRVLYDAIEGIPDYESTSLSGTPGLAQVVTYTYDDLNRPLTESRLLFGGSESGSVDTTYSYDDSQSKVVIRRGTRATTLKYDGAGRLAYKILPDGSQTTFNYTDGTRTVTTTQTNRGPYVEEQQLDGLGLPSALSQAGELVRTEIHDIDGRIVSSSKAGAGTNGITYDWDKRISWADDQVSDDPEKDIHRHFIWDRNNRLHSSTDGDGNETKLFYDGLDRVVRSVDPLLRTTTAEYYPGTSLVSARSWPSGRSQQNTYDPAGQLVGDVTHEPGIPTDLNRQFTYAPLGGIATATISGGLEVENTTTRQYDSVGSLIYENNTLWPYDVGKYSDADDRSLWLMVGTNVAYADSVDDLYRFTGLGWLGFGTIKVWDYGTGVGGPLSAWMPSGATESYSYDNRGRRIGTDVVAQDGTPIISIHDALGIDGVLRARQTTIGTAETTTDVYQVDYAERVLAENHGIANAQIPLSGTLTNASVAAYAASGANWKTFSYRKESDASSVGSAAGASNRTYDEIHRLVTRSDLESPNYDPDDRTTAIPDAAGTKTFTFNAVDNLVAASNGSETATYVHDALGRRILEVSGTETTAYVWYDQRLMVHGSEANGYTLELYGQGFDEHIYSGSVNNGYGPDGEWHFVSGFYYMNAPDGQVAALSDAYTTIETYSYSAYGQPRMTAQNGTEVAASQYGNRFLYRGQLYDPISQTFSLRNRQYSPELQRFLTPDPLGFGGGSMNLFSYCGSGPLSKSDPLGLEAIPGTRVAGADDASAFRAAARANEPNQLVPGETGDVFDIFSGTALLAGVETYRIRETAPGGDLYFYPAAYYAQLNMFENTFSYDPPPPLAPPPSAYPPWEQRPTRVDSRTPAMKRFEQRMHDMTFAPLTEFLHDSGLERELEAMSVLPIAGGLRVVSETGELETLLTRAHELHEVLDDVARTHRVTTILQTAEGVNVVAGGVRDIDPAQRAVLQTLEAAATLPGAHSEVTALTFAAKNGLLPDLLVATSRICPECIAYIEKAGGTLTSGVTASWRKR
jgi:RHS repeat-associated protein